MCRIIAGPAIGWTLAEYGADVLKFTAPYLSQRRTFLSGRWVSYDFVSIQMLYAMSISSLGSSDGLCVPAMFH